MRSDPSVAPQCFFAPHLLVLALAGLFRTAEAGDLPANATRGAQDILGQDFEGAKIAAIQGTNVVTVELRNGTTRTVATFREAQRFRGLTRPYWSADGQELVFAYDGQAHRMNADGSNRREVLQGQKAYEAKFWDDPETGERCIVGTTVNGKHWYPRNRGVGETYLHRLGSGTKTKLADFPFGGTLSPDGTHLADAYGGLLIKEMASGEVHVLYGGKQSCNSSLSPDDTYRIMHLYLPHKYFGFRNKFDEELWRFDQPSETGELQTPRWSNHPDFCCATAKLGNDYKIMVIHIPTKKYTVLRELPGSWTVPLLWVPSAAPGGRALGVTAPAAGARFVPGTIKGEGTRACAPAS